MTNFALLFAPVAVPAVLAALYAAAGWRTWTAWLGLAGPGAALASAAVLIGRVRAGGVVTVAGSAMLRADALTVWLLLVIGAVGLLATWVSPAYIAADLRAGHATAASARRYGLLVQAFLAAMALAVLAGNLGVLWAAIEATTIVTAFLVGHRRTRASVEAAWKYVVICSVGIGCAFLGTVLIYDAARHAGIPENQALDWATLAAHAHQLNPAVTRLGFALIVFGFGTKAGLVPLHAWLPDAHSQAPAPVSALMSGVLLAVSFTALLRYKVIADAALGTGFARGLLAGVALLTLALATALLLGQRDYKRMLAYSSMEHMALIALAAAAGTRLALAALLLHIAGHGLAKTVAFCSAGHVQQLVGSTRIDAVQGLGATAPVVGGALGVAVLALLGLPPFAPFASEIAIVRGGINTSLGWVIAAALVLMIGAYAALAARGAGMLLGAPPPDEASVSAARPSAAVATPLVVGLLACAALGIGLGPLHPLLDSAAAILTPR